jgi:hypothetical protein
MSVWGAIGSGLGKIGEGLATGAKKVGEVAKTGAQKAGSTLGKTPQNLPNIDVDNLTFDPANKPLPNIDDLTFDPNKKAPVDIDKLTFEDMLNGEESQPKKTGQDGFANALSGRYDFQYSPSMIDYSPYMGLSPETQRYLYGGM